MNAGISHRHFLERLETSVVLFDAVRVVHTLYLEMTWYNGEQHCRILINVCNEFAVVIVFLRISGSVMYWEDTRSSTTVS